MFLSYIFQHPFLILICILCAWREYGVCKHGCTSASFGTELDTSTYPPSTSFLFRHTRYLCICFRFVGCKHHVLVVWTVEQKSWLCIKHITPKLWGTSRSCTKILCAYSTWKNSGKERDSASLKHVHKHVITMPPHQST